MLASLFLFLSLSRSLPLVESQCLFLSAFSFSFSFRVLIHLRLCPPLAQPRSLSPVGSLYPPARLSLPLLACRLSVCVCLFLLLSLFLCLLSMCPAYSRANDVQRIHFILFHFAADPTTRLISSGQRRLADPKLWEYVTGRENPTEAAHSLFLYAMCPPHVSPRTP